CPGDGDAPGCRSNRRAARGSCWDCSTSCRMGYWSYRGGDMWPTHLGIIDVEGARHTLALTGELDLETAPALELAVSRACEAGARSPLLSAPVRSSAPSGPFRRVQAGDALPTLTFAAARKFRELHLHRLLRTVAFPDGDTDRFTWPTCRQDVGRFSGAVDRLAVDSGDQVPGDDSGLGGWSARLHRGHHGTASFERARGQFNA